MNYPLFFTPPRFDSGGSAKIQTKQKGIFKAKTIREGGFQPSRKMVAFLPFLRALIFKIRDAGVGI